MCRGFLLPWLLLNDRAGAHAGLGAGKCELAVLCTSLRLPPCLFLSLPSSPTLCLPPPRHSALSLSPPWGEQMFSLRVPSRLKAGSWYLRPPFLSPVPPYSDNATCPNTSGRTKGSLWLKHLQPFTQNFLKSCFYMWLFLYWVEVH